MNFEKFTIKSQEAIQKAIELAQTNGQQAIETAHLLKAILTVADAVSQFIVQKLNINIAQLNQSVDGLIRSLPKVSGGQPYVSNETNKVLQTAQSLSEKAGNQFVSVEYIVLALVKEKSNISQLFKELGVNEQNVEAAISELTKNQKVTSPSAEDTYQALSKYAVNLNERHVQVNLTQ